MVDIAFALFIRKAVQELFIGLQSKVTDVKTWV